MRRRNAYALLAPVAFLAACWGGRQESGPSDDASLPDTGPVEAGAPSGDVAETGSAPHDATGAGDATAAIDSGDADADAGPECAPFGAPGQCITVSACAALGDHSSYAGYCPGPANIECCIDTPDVTDDPPVPAGWQLMQQSQVTAAMTTWAVAILNDPVTYPMFSTTTKTFGTLDVLARVEWHPPDFQNNVVHRGVTLYEPTD
jgi:hypothetical protein